MGLVDGDALVVLLGVAGEVTLGGGQPGPEAAAHQVAHQQDAEEGQDDDQGDWHGAPAPRLARLLWANERFVVTIFFIFGFV